MRGQAAQTLFSPAGWLQARAARRLVTASRAEAGTAAQDAGARAGVAYVGVVQARALLAERRRELKLATDLLGVAQAQLQAGVGTRLDVVRAQTQIAASRAGIELARGQLTQAQIDLARALGLAPGVEFALSDSLGPRLGRASVPEDSGAAVALALQRRPELATATAQLFAARAAERAVAARRLGQLQLVGDYGLNGPAPDNLITTGRLALQYSIPFFEGFRLEGQRHERAAQRGEASVRLGDLREQVAGEVQGALAAVQSGEARQALAGEQVRLAEEELREARLQFSNGLAGNIAVINAQQDLVRASDAMIEALAATARARVRLARAVGVTQSLQ